MIEKKKFKTGERIISKGDEAVCAYVILSGKVRVFLDKDGREVTLAELEPGSIFGETALFGMGVYGAHVAALEETYLQIITRDSFAGELAECSPLMRSIVQMLIERQQKTNEALLKSETREFMDIAFI